ncbi:MULTISPECIES: SDR family NAD(P)-dependent oxidoreductase [unclassified Streptomyces]|uniref:SDR family NAD(P)-dependent oxidoreductase n=1 Tax=unclassified Streptomyces TaxID=2593676 RepID=UPI000BAC7D51|nr:MULTISPECIES: SDR family NAD(P)-dependent oxidoreductase [unclassified Streptomyces]ASY31762.1 short-chain dehydrogenase [Streptomyces sp. CLI2509]MYX20792.1 SDR family NAD(P)-dependent oxidoreductase [Streptomyces sp. SID8380]
MASAVVVGAGPGIGASVAARLAREGLAVTVVARSPGTLRDVTERIGRGGGTVRGLIADSTDEKALRAALDTAASADGPVELLVYNAALIRPDAPGELDARGQLDAWAVNVVGALTAAAHVAPGMAARGRGTILVTGGMPEPEPEYVSLSLGKAGVRTLVGLLHGAYGSAGVHVASVTVPGAVAPGGENDPDEIAAHYWRLHTQPREQWQHELVHGADHTA